MFKKILVPTDGSDSAKKAVAIASDLAKQYDASMVLLHVIGDYNAPKELAHFAEMENLPEAKTSQHIEPLIASPPHVVVTTPIGADEQVERHAALRIYARNILQEAAAAARQHGVKKIETRTAEGDPTTEILERVGSEQVDGIVMGSRGMSDVKGAFVGSVSHKVCHSADCTCITVC